VVPFKGSQPKSHTQNPLSASTTAPTQMAAAAAPGSCTPMTTSTYTQLERPALGAILAVASAPSLAACAKTSKQEEEEEEEKEEEPSARAAWPRASSMLRWPSLEFAAPLHSCQPSATSQGTGQGGGDGGGGEGSICFTLTLLPRTRLNLLLLLHLLLECHTHCSEHEGIHHP
jgi:hypothetical protein